MISLSLEVMLFKIQVKYLSLSCSLEPLVTGSEAFGPNFKVNAVHCYNAEPEEEALPLHTAAHPYYQVLLCTVCRSPSVDHPSGTC